MQCTRARECLPTEWNIAIASPLLPDYKRLGRVRCKVDVTPTFSTVKKKERKEREKRAAPKLEDGGKVEGERKARKRRNYGP